MPDLTEHLPDEYRREVEKVIARGLRAAINDHGPIDAEHIGSAAKRVFGSLLSGGYLADPSPPVGPDGRATG